MQLLQLFCSNQNHEMQSFLRLQPKARRSVNFMREVSDMVEEFAMVVYDATAPLMVQLWKALRAFMLGPHVENQGRSRMFDGETCACVCASLCCGSLVRQCAWTTSASVQPQNRGAPIFMMDTTNQQLALCTSH